MIISGKNLSKKYGGLKAVDDVNIQCNSGTVTGLLGTNGAGKSTLFKLLLGLVKPDEGSVTVNSVRPKPLGGIIEKPCLYNYLNARENLNLFSKIQGAPTSKMAIDGLLEKVGLPLDRKDPVKNYSMGMQQRLGIAIALINQPEGLILDEPFSGLDPIGVENLRELILELAKKDGIAVLIASHNVDELQKCCNFLYVIQNGTIIKSEATEDLISQHTTKYHIVGKALMQSDILKIYNPKVQGLGVEIECGTADIGKVLQELTAQGITINSCTPRIDLHKLFQPTEQ
ncbi:ABC transporter ATP-binding protein [Muricauda sp. CAU 1633]|uniref:ABC transporter ATP-binding protein n=1 Tax=Allomuricauda sp. CAU 1633 TaxID=2816036 RepID=UPI001A8C30A5|nr:ABC transporter ATP-binding protein [Muricauda sp. CAU 1633]MBO0322730.1 ABC transporter ATP-binding protein [Muricauda sp. CAU 1633]